MTLVRHIYLSSNSVKQRKRHYVHCGSICKPDSHTTMQTGRYSIIYYVHSLHCTTPSFINLLCVLRSDVLYYCHICSHALLYRSTCFFVFSYLSIYLVRSLYQNASYSVPAFTDCTVCCYALVCTIVPHSNLSLITLCQHSP